MADYERRVILALTRAEADALDVAIQDMQGNIANGWDVPAREVAALLRAKGKLVAAQSRAERRNAEKATAKTGSRRPPVLPATTSTETE